MKKLKCVFIDIVDDRRRRTKGQEEGISYYSTFQEYLFNQHITSRVSQLFGWTTSLMKVSDYGNEIKICIHVITLNYLRNHGVSQHFYSPHGPDYDDKYSYLHGMNLLAFEGYNRVHLIYSIKRISTVFQTKRITDAINKKRLVRRKKRKRTNSFELVTEVPVDQPRIGILTPITNLNKPWVRRIKKYKENIIISDDIRNLVPEVDPDNFIDYSLSRNYKFILDDYIYPLNSILEVA